MTKMGPPTEVEPSHISHSFRKCPTQVCLQASGMAIFQSWLLFPDDCSLCSVHHNNKIQDAVCVTVILDMQTPPDLEGKSD